MERRDASGRSGKMLDDFFPFFTAFLAFFIGARFGAWTATYSGSDGFRQKYDEFASRSEY
jgi:hypothetical protein